MAGKLIKWPHQHLPLQNPLKITQIAIFGFKMYHLATLSSSWTFEAWKPILFHPM
jgi:hypothetical protein